jgi:hypothetical protein
VTISRNFFIPALGGTSATAVDPSIRPLHRAENRAFPRRNARARRPTNARGGAQGFVGKKEERFQVRLVADFVLPANKARSQLSDKSIFSILSIDCVDT